MKLPLVSVIVPVFNVEQYIETAIKHIKTYGTEYYETCG